MRIVVLGAAGFIGTNLLLSLTRNPNNDIIAVDEYMDYFDESVRKLDVNFLESKFETDTNFFEILQGADIVYHLISTNNPTSSNKNIGSDIANNVLITVDILEACVNAKVNRVVFISSGGTVYGDRALNPINENEETNPINTYGIQKLTIEKILYLYYKMHNLDYRIIRLANPYGPFQRPNGRLGVVTTFVYKALNEQVLNVYGDGTVIRDYIYIDDAVKGIIDITFSDTDEKIYNLGSGVGVSVKQIIDIISKHVGESLKVKYFPKRSVDVPINILDVTKYKKAFQVESFIDIDDGIQKTMDYFREKG